MPRIIFGDNHLFGINHLSLGKAEQYKNFYSEPKHLEEIFRSTKDYSIGEQMLSSHASAGFVYKIALDVHPNLLIHPVIPYAHAINDRAASVGVVKTAVELLRPSFSDTLRMVYEILVPGKSLRIPYSSVRRFVSVQLAAFSDVPSQNRGVLFLNNVFSDLLLGFGMFEWFEHFPKVCDELGYGAGVITYNPTFFLEHHYEGLTLCINYNHRGHLSGLGPQRLQELVSIYNVWAMGIFGSGAYALPDVVSDKNLAIFDGVVFASSKPKRIEEFTKAFL